MSESTPETMSDVPQDGEPKVFDEVYVKRLRAEAAEWRTKARAGESAATRLAELEESNKSESQRLEERAVAAQRDRDAAVRQSLVYEVALAKGLAPDLAKRIVGSTREELEADADAVLALVMPPEPAPTTNPQGFAVVPAMQGARPSPPPPTDMNSIIRARLGRG